MLNEHRFDIVLMDGHMPLMDGHEATMRIRNSNATYSGIPIIGVTAEASWSALQAFRNAGADHVMSKPFALAQLREMIAQLIQKSHGTGVSKS